MSEDPYNLVKNDLQIQINKLSNDKLIRKKQLRKILRDFSSLCKSVESVKNNRQKFSHIDESELSNRELELILISSLIF